MDIISLFKEAVRSLADEKITFAVGGGFAASLYRSQFRVTNDVDILIYAVDDSLGKAQTIIKSLGLKPGIARKADLEGGPAFAIKNKSTEPQIVVGRADHEQPGSPGLDFLLPTLPWQERALARAQENMRDFGFGPLPCITVEDVIVAKLYALKNRADRFKDLDDLQSIFSMKHSLDLGYIGGVMTALRLPVPKGLEGAAPDALNKLSKAIRSQDKKKPAPFPANLKQSS